MPDETIKWVDDAIISSSDTQFGTYRAVQVRLDTWSCGIYVEGALTEIVKHDCISLDHAKRQAQDHFNSKLKLCLNREL